MAVQVDTIYQILSVNLLLSLLKCHDKSGNELHKNMFNSENLKKFDCVFDPETCKKNRESMCKFIHSNVCVERSQECSHSKTANTHFM